MTLTCAIILYIATNVQSTHDKVILLENKIDVLSENQFSPNDFLIAIVPYEKRITKNEADIKTLYNTVSEVKDRLFVKGYLKEAK